MHIFGRVELQVGKSRGLSFGSGHTSVGWHEARLPGSTAGSGTVSTLGCGATAVDCFTAVYGSTDRPGSTRTRDSLGGRYRERVVSDRTALPEEMRPDVLEQQPDEQRQHQRHQEVEDDARAHHVPLFEVAGPEDDGVRGSARERWLPSRRARQRRFLDARVATARPTVSLIHRPWPLLSLLIIEFHREGLTYLEVLDECPDLLVGEVGGVELEQFAAPVG